MKAYTSWGRYPKLAAAKVERPRWRDDVLPFTARQSLLAYGNGRSYGDSCLNEGGCLLDTRGLDRFIHFDKTTGVLRAEAGVLLTDILQFCLPDGWFLPVTPGTQYVTLGGAVANDVHGKNHHGAGSFGCHVRAFELLRSDGQRLICSQHDNAALFQATIGGLGLTGVILWVELALKRVAGTVMEVESQQFSALDGFYELSEQADQRHEYSVAWVDCLAHGPALGRGWLFSANHAQTHDIPSPDRAGGWTMPLTPPVSLINRGSLRLFNQLYYRKPRPASQRQHYQPYFYPLDKIRYWNRVYGPKGFLQYQCVVPPGDERSAIAAILARIAVSGTGSFLAVLKRFGNRASPGLLSFPRPGTTLALDFPNQGADSLRLLENLDALVLEVGGAIYPAKDARMSTAMFKASFPRLSDFVTQRDPGMSSSFWRRVMEE